MQSHAWAIRTTINPNIKHSPSHLAFLQDMIFRRAIKIDWETVLKNRTRLAKLLNAKENNSRINKHYHPGDQVLIVKDSAEHHSQSKMDKPTQGPFIITKLFSNGTVEINRNTSTEAAFRHRMKKTIKTPFFMGENDKQSCIIFTF
jgi:hypothetical protein